MKRIVVAFAIALLIPVVTQAQGASAMAREFFSAHSKQDWPAVTNLVDTTAFAMAREKANELIEQIDERTGQMNQGDPSRMAALRPMMDRLMLTMIGATFARVKNVDELKQLSDRDMMSRWLEAKSARYQVSNMGNLLGGLAGLGGLLGGTTGAMPGNAQATLDSASAMVAAITIEWQVVGEVAEGNALTHVAYRPAGLTPTASTGVLSFKLIGGRWRVAVSSLEDEDQLGVFAGLENLAIQSKMK
jgi:hypothetical protein